MSLVNDMLTDLDSRTQGELDESVLIDRQQPQKNATESKRNTSFFFLVLVIGVAAVWLGSQWRGILSTQDSKYSDILAIENAQANENILLEQGSIERPLVNVPIANEVAEIKANIAETSVAGGVEGSVESIEPINPSLALNVVEDQLAIPSKTKIDANYSVAPSSAVHSVADPVQDLLVSAQRALSANKLTTPSGDNAFSIYQKILYSNPDNIEAREGIRNIAERYIALADDLYLRGEWDRAQRYDNKASYVASFYPEVAAWLDGINRPSPERHLSNRSDSESLARNMNSSGSVTRGSAVDLISEEKSNESLLPRMKVAKSQLTQELKFIEEAKSLLKQGAVNAAESVLINGQHAYPQSTNINTMLFDIYLVSNRQAIARQYLDKFTQLAPFESAFLESRLLVAEQKNSEAITLLERFSPDVKQATDFYRLLAGLYQKEGRYAESAQQYRKLLSVDDRQATYWLGLAVSLDALRDDKGALQAFHSVRQYGISDRETRAYVDQRIRILSS